MLACCCCCCWRLSTSPFAMPWPAWRERVRFSFQVSVSQLSFGGLALMGFGGRATQRASLLGTGTVLSRGRRESPCVGNTGIAHRFGTFRYASWQQIGSTCTISPPLDIRGAVPPVLVDGSPVIIYHTSYQKGKMTLDPFDRTDPFTEPL
jgi:hypothetical protein